MEEIIELENQIEETNKHIEELKKQLEELKQEISKQDKKEHKSLSDYRVYRELEDDKPYKFIGYGSCIDAFHWCDDKTDKKLFSYGNVYSIDTPNELLEREIKKRQLWFELEKHLKENNCLATSEDWKDCKRLKYSPIYYYDTHRYCINSLYYHKINTIYSTNEDVLRDYMNTLTQEDIKIMFDVD